MLRGIVHHRQGDYPAALSNLNQAISLDEKDGSALFIVGLIKYEMGEREAAINQWQKAVAIDKKNPRIKMVLAVALYDRGDIDRGLATAEEALKLDKGVSDLKYLKEKYFWGKKLLADAQKLLAHPRIQALLSQAE